MGLATFVFALSCAGPPTGDPEQPSFQIAVQDLRGAPVELAAGVDEVLVVEFWATWCGTCVRAKPFFDRLHRDYADKGVRVVAISTDDTREVVERELAARPRAYSVLWDPQGRAAAPYITHLFVAYLPTTLVLDRQGQIRYSHREWDTEAPTAIEGHVKALLAARP